MDLAQLLVRCRNDDELACPQISVSSLRDHMPLCEGSRGNPENGTTGGKSLSEKDSASNHKHRTVPPSAALFLMRNHE